MATSTREALVRKRRSIARASPKSVLNLRSDQASRGRSCASSFAGSVRLVDGWRVRDEGLSPPDFDVDSLVVPARRLRVRLASGISSILRDSPDGRRLVDPLVSLVEGLLAGLLVTR